MHIIITGTRGAGLYENSIIRAVVAPVVADCTPMNPGSNPFFLGSGARLFWAVWLSLLALSALLALIRHAHFGPWVGDYLAFWVAAQALLAGTATQLYDPNTFQHLLATTLPGYQGALGWFYPPSFLLLIAPLGYLSFLPGMLLFEGGGLLALYAVVRRILPRSTGIAPLAFLLASPAVWINILSGQNGLWSAALAGASLLTQRTRPILSGLLLGLLSVKPQLALVLGVLYFFSEQRQSFWVALVTALFLLIAGCWVSGVAVSTWLHSLQTASQFASTRITPTLTTVFGLLKLLGMPAGWAYGVQGVSSLLALLYARRVWRSSAQAPARWGAACVATLLFSPYLLYYDEVWWVLSAAFLAASGRSLTTPEKILAGACWIYPALPSVVSAALFHFQITPILMGLAILLFKPGHTAH